MTVIITTSIFIIRGSVKTDAGIPAWEVRAFGDKKKAERFRDRCERSAERMLEYRDRVMSRKSIYNKQREVETLLEDFRRKGPDPNIDAEAVFHDEIEYSISETILEV